MVNCPPEVETAVPADAPALLALLKLMHAETGMAPLDDLRVRQMIWRGVTQQEAVIGVIRGKGPRHIEGSIGLFTDRLWYSARDHLADFWNFVAEPHRKSTHAKNLIEFAKWAALTVDRPLVMSMMANERTAAKLRLYERQLPKAGALFVFNAPEIACSPVTP